MANGSQKFTTRELSMRTVSDFERFFWQVNGCGCAFYLLGRHLPLPPGSAKKAAPTGEEPGRRRNWPR